MTFERHSDKEVYNIFKSNLCLLHMMSHIRMNEVAYLSSTYHHTIHSGGHGDKYERTGMITHLQCSMFWMI